MLTQEIIRIQRDGTLSAEQIGEFVRGLVDGGWSDGQAPAMAILLCRMDAGETLALTESMTRSGQMLAWDDTGLDSIGAHARCVPLRPASPRLGRVEA